MTPTQKTSREKLREKLADLAHKQWAGWTRWMLDNLDEIHIKNWHRQMNTPYVALSEKEKNSDRKEADRVLQIVLPEITKVLKEFAKEIKLEKKKVYLHNAPSRLVNQCNFGWNSAKEELDKRMRKFLKSRK